MAYLEQNKKKSCFTDSESRPHSQIADAWQFILNRFSITQGNPSLRRVWSIDERVEVEKSNSLFQVKELLLCLDLLLSCIDPFRWPAMQVYFGERAHFYQVSANSEEAWGETKKRPRGWKRGMRRGRIFHPSNLTLSPLTFPKLMMDNMAANLLDRELIPITREHLFRRRLQVGSTWSQGFIYIANKWTETYLRL